MLRTPLLPIWITKVNGSYGMIFCTSRDLVADWKTERFFSVHYYTGHDAQQKPTCISIGELPYQKFPHITDVERRAVSQVVRIIDSIGGRRDERSRRCA